MEFDESCEDDQERDDEVEETDEDTGEDGDGTIEEDDDPEDGDGTIEEGDDPEEAPEEAAELPTEEVPDETAELPTEIPDGPKEAELPPEVTTGLKEDAELPPEVTFDPKESVERAVDEIIKDQGKNISPSAKELADDAKVELMPQTGTRLGVTSRPSSGTATVRIAASTPAKMEMTARHEANHLVSNLHHVLIPKSPSSYEVHHTSGFRHVAEVHTLNKGATIKETGRGFNEAVTQRLAEKAARDDPELGKADAHGYREASALVGALETLIGPEVIAQNYYAGGTGVKDAFNELAGERASYEQFLEACDRAISHNAQERQAGVHDALEILAILEEAKDSK